MICDFGGLSGLWDKNTMVSSHFKSVSSALLIGKSHRLYYNTNTVPSGPQGLCCVRKYACMIVSGRLIRYSGVNVYQWMCSLGKWRWLVLIWNVCVIILYVRVSLVMSLVVGYYLSYLFTECNLWFFFLVCVSATDYSACAFVNAQDFLCFLACSTLSSRQRLTACLRWTRSNVFTVSKQQFIL